MSTAVQTPDLPAPTLDVSSTTPVPFGRLVAVEARKMIDTRAGRWLVISTGLVTALVLVVQLWIVIAQDLQVDFLAFIVGMNLPMAIFLPVLGIMAVTQEFSQHTALTTFALTPSRLRVMAAKFVATLGYAVGAVVVGLLLAVLANVLYGAFSESTPVWEFGIEGALRLLLYHLLGMSIGFALGALFLNTPVAVVAYFVLNFVLSGLFELGAALVEWIRDVRPWVDFGVAQEPLLDPTMSSTEWAHLGVAGLWWLLLPLALGMWRVLRAEIK